jgi:hypothetical protein
MVKKNVFGITTLGAVKAVVASTIGLGLERLGI